MKARRLSLFLVVIMLAAILAPSAFAEEGQTVIVTELKGYQSVEGVFDNILLVKDNQGKTVGLKEDGSVAFTLTDAYWTYDYLAGDRMFVERQSDYRVGLLDSKGNVEFPLPEGHEFSPWHWDEFYDTDIPIRVTYYDEASEQQYTYYIDRDFNILFELPAGYYGYSFETGGYAQVDYYDRDTDVSQTYLIDKTGNTVFTLPENHVISSLDYEQGFVVAEYYDYTTGEGYTYVTDMKGTKLFDFPADSYVSGFSEDIWVIYRYDYETGTSVYSYYDKTGKLIYTAPDGYYGNGFNEGFATVYGYGYEDGTLLINTSGTVVKQFPAGHYTNGFSEGLICVYHYDDNGVVHTYYADETGTTVITLNPGEHSYSFNDGRAYVYTYDDNGESYWYIDKSGTVVEGPYKYEDWNYENEIQSEIFEGFSLTMSYADKYGYHIKNVIDENGVIIFKFPSVVNGENFGNMYDVGNAVYVGINNYDYDANESKRAVYRLALGSDEPIDALKPSVNEAISRGLVPEQLKSRYSAEITRAEFCALAVNFYETVKGTEITARKTFADDGGDVNVQKMAGLGIVNGVGDGTTFNPSGTFDRQQAATLIVILIEKMGFTLEAGDVTAFADNAKMAGYAKPYIGKAVKAGIMAGTGSSFAPDRIFSRQESIVLMNNVFNKYGK